MGAVSSFRGHDCSRTIKKRKHHQASWCGAVPRALGFPKPVFQDRPQGQREAQGPRASRPHTDSRFQPGKLCDVLVHAGGFWVTHPPRGHERGGSATPLVSAWC